MGGQGMQVWWNKIWVRALVTAVSAVLFADVFGYVAFLALAKLNEGGDTYFVSLSVSPRLLLAAVTIAPFWGLAEMFVKRYAWLPSVKAWIGFVALYCALDAVFNCIGIAIWMRSVLIAENVPYPVCMVAVWLLTNAGTGLIAWLWYNKARPRTESTTVF